MFGIKSQLTGLFIGLRNLKSFAKDTVASNNNNNNMSKYQEHQKTLMCQTTTKGIKMFWDILSVKA